jgi:hypothetical protein
MNVPMERLDQGLGEATRAKKLSRPSRFFALFLALALLALLLWWLLG